VGGSQVVPQVGGGRWVPQVPGAHGAQVEQVPQVPRWWVPGSVLFQVGGCPRCLPRPGGWNRWVFRVGGWVGRVATCAERAAPAPDILPPHTYSRCGTAVERALPGARARTLALLRTLRNARSLPVRAISVQ